MGGGDGFNVRSEWAIVSQRHLPASLPFPTPMGIAKKNPGGTSVGTEAADRWQRLRQAVRPDQSSQNSQTSVCLVGWYRWQGESPPAGLVPRPIRVLFWFLGLCQNASDSVPARVCSSVYARYECALLFVRCIFLVQNFLPTSLYSNVIFIVFYCTVERNNIPVWETTSENYAWRRD